MPPYWNNIANAAFGYLKGYLTAHDAPVTTVHWNLYLSKKIGALQTVLTNFPRFEDTFPSESIAFYIYKKLMGINSVSPTIVDQAFTSLYTEEELAEAIHKIREDIDTYITKFKLYDTLLSGFTMKTYQWMMGSYIIGRLRDMNPDTKVVMGGIYNKEHASTVMRVFPHVDYAIWGEGEYPLLQLVKAVDGGDVTTVPHLMYREGKTVVATNVQDEQPPLDEYPFADHTDYFTMLKKVDPFNKAVLIPIWGSRACPWNKCKFCAINEEYRYRTRSPENIVEEIEYQSKKHRVSNFQFTDSDIAGNKKRFITLLQLIIQSMRERRKPYHICAEISPLFIDPEIALFMKRAGFVETQTGVESLSESLLKKMQKRQTLVHNIQALKSAQQCGLPLFGLNIIRGIPTETEEDVKESCTNVKFFRFMLHFFLLDPTICMLLKYSPFYDEMSEKEREKWDQDLLWEEAASTGIVAEEDRFEFFNFYRKTFRHYHLWDTFWSLLRLYGVQNSSYTWLKTPNGSLIEEKGKKSVIHELSQTETDVLVFCDTIKSFSEVQKEFSLQEAELCTILSKLNNNALLYSDTDGNCISILNAAQKHAQ